MKWWATAALVAVLVCGEASAMRWPTYGGSLSFAHRHAPFDLSSALQLEGNAMLFACVYESLFRLERNGRPLPNLVEDDGQLDATHNSWTLKLRPGLRWSDGRPLLARDVARALRRLPQWLRHPFSAISAPNSLTLRLRLRFSVPHRTYLLAYLGTAITRELQTGGRSRLIGSGPFRLVQRRGKTVLLANRWYHRGRPYLDAVKLVPTESAANESDRFYLDQVDATLVPSPLYGRKRQKPKETATPLDATLYLLFNQRSSAFNSASARRAAWGALNLSNLRRFTPYPARVARSLLPQRFHLRHKLSQPTSRGQRFDSSQPVVLIFDRDRPGHQALAKAILSDISNTLHVSEIRFAALDTREFRKRVEAMRGFDIALVETLHLTRSKRVALAALMHELTPATRLLATIHNGSFGLAEQLDRWMRSVPFAPLLHLRRTLYRKALLSRTPFRGDGLLDLFELFLAGSGEPR